MEAGVRSRSRQEVSYGVRFQEIYCRFAGKSAARFVTALEVRRRTIVSKPKPDRGLAARAPAARVGHDPIFVPAWRRTTAELTDDEVLHLTGVPGSATGLTRPDHNTRRLRCCRDALSVLNGAAAASPFSSQGYRATSVRDIADRAGTSTGSVYHHFRDKEAIFQTLLDHFWQASSSPDFPLIRVFEDGAFPHNLPAIGRAAQDTVTTWRPYIALIYIDVVEFEGRHIHRFYANLAARFEEFLVRRPDLHIEDRMREGVPPALGMVLTTRIYMYYFIVETLFGVRTTAA
jgi:AcrR family transcriptional regulator